MSADREPDIDHDIYQAPEADLETGVETGTADYYVVSRNKFLILFMATMGIYSVYWFYRHWNAYRLRSGRKLLPVMRAIFSIFFAHKLFELFYEDARLRQPDLKWRHGWYAVFYILLSVVSNLIDNLTKIGVDVGVISLAFLGMIVAIALILRRAQGVANLACGDPAGEANSRLGIANYAWILLGLVFWLLTIVGTFLPPDLQTPG